jgi:hypothetical protein
MDVSQATALLDARRWWRETPRDDRAVAIVSAVAMPLVAKISLAVPSWVNHRVILPPPFGLLPGAAVLVVAYGLISVAFTRARPRVERRARLRTTAVRGAAILAIVLAIGVIRIIWLSPPLHDAFDSVGRAKAFVLSIVAAFAQTKTFALSVIAATVGLLVWLVVFLLRGNMRGDESHSPPPAI